jgi:hypothetical protein
MNTSKRMGIKYVVKKFFEVCHLEGLDGHIRNIKIPICNCRIGLPWSLIPLKSILKNMKSLCGLSVDSSAVKKIIRGI